MTKEYKWYGGWTLKKIRKVNPFTREAIKAWKERNGIGDGDPIPTWRELCEGERNGTRPNFHADVDDTDVYHLSDPNYKLDRMDIEMAWNRGFQDCLDKMEEIEGKKLLKMWKQKDKEARKAAKLYQGLREYRRVKLE